MGEPLGGLEVPCLLWTTIYWFLWDVVPPLLTGRRLLWPPATLWLSGFEHLWFLQFLMLGAVVTYPLIRLAVRYRGSRWVPVVACPSAAFAYGMWMRPHLQLHAASGWIEHTDLSLRVGIRQSIAFGTYIPVGVALALSADAIGGLYRRRAFRILTLAGLAAALVGHLWMVAPAVSRLLYSAAVFVVLLRPWRPGSLAWLEPMARYPYLIYILHPLVMQIAGVLLGWARPAPSGAALVAGSLGVFAASGLVAVSLRTIMPRDWILPLIPVRMSRSRGVAPRHVSPQS